MTAGPNYANCGSWPYGVCVELSTIRTVIREWAGRRSARWLGDIGLMVVVAVIVDLQIRLTYEPGSRPVDVGAYAIGTLFALPLPARRRWPLATLLFCIVVFLAYNAVNYPGFSPVLPWAIPLYSTARAGRLTVAVLAATSAITLTFLFSLDKLAQSMTSTLAEVLREAALLASLVLLGEAVRTRRALAQQAQLAADQAAIEREHDWQRRLTEERLHIARELHDVLAHTLTTASLQAGIASDALPDGAVTSQEALTAVLTSHRQARAELAATVNVLRTAGTDLDKDVQAPGTSPAGLAKLDSLVDGMRNAGLQVDVAVEGQPQPLPPAVDLTAYRIVQQSLTNVVQHGQARSATVSLSYGPSELAISVVDDGPGSTYDEHEGDDRPGGFGVIGMRERASAIGGDLTAGPRPGGGFTVHAALPLQRQD